MIHSEEEERIGLEEILANPLIGGRGNVDQGYGHGFTGGFDGGKMRVGDLGQNNSRASLYGLGRNDNVRKPMTPVASTMSSMAPTKQHSPITPPSNSRTYNQTMKSS